MGQEALEDFRLYRGWAVRKGLLEEVALGTAGFGDESLGSEGAPGQGHEKGGRGI